MKTKKPIFIIFNDAHLGVGNEQEVVKSVIHMLDYATTHSIENIIFAGDLFHSRKHQEESVLRAFDEILALFVQHEKKLYIFAGNHDKTSYFSYGSFLDSYRYHPNVYLNTHPKDIIIANKKITLIPFFDDSILVPLLEQHEGGDILISHFEMYGSSYLGRVSDKSTITKELLSKWKVTYLGHYHNYHQVAKGIYHLPSLRQSSFGEDNNKGFTIIYDDLSFHIVKGVFKEFKKEIINVDKLSLVDIKELINTHKNSTDTVRFELVGSETKLQIFDKSIFENTGIDIKSKFTKVYDVEPVLIKEFDKSNIQELFKQFCTDKKHDYKKGVIFLDKYLVNQ